MTKEQLRDIISNYRDRNKEETELTFVLSETSDLFKNIKDDGTVSFEKDYEELKQDIKLLSDLAEMLNSSRHGLTDDAYIECLDYYLLNSQTIINYFLKLFFCNDVNQVIPISKS